ncbi:MAG: N-acetylmuramoyl-L-alanine amidase [Cyclobacteriaceae bacterium]|jgi:N-acetylmuramoyl-L-alanine amidase
MLYRLACMLIFSLCVALSSSAQEAFNVTPNKGEGIFELLERHDIPKDFAQDFIKVNKSKLGAKDVLLSGFQYELRKAWQVIEKEEWRTYSIFGKKHEKVKIIDQSLKGGVFYLVSGHGGPDPGAVGKKQGKELCEDEYAYDVTIRLARWLIERDALVYLIIRDDNDGIRDEAYLKCDKDEYAYTRGKVPRGHNDRLIQRTDIVNSLYKQNRSASYHRMVAIHVDSRSKKENVDVFFYYHHLSSTGKQAANDLLSTFDSKYQEYQPNRDYRGNATDRSGLFVLKNTNPPAVFIELGNITNDRDQRRFLIVDNRQALAKWIGEGLKKNFERGR